MSLQMNQFESKPTNGQLALGVGHEHNVMTVQSNDTNAIAVAQGACFDTTTPNPVPMVAGYSNGNSDAIGIVLYDTMKERYEQLDFFTVALKGSVIYMTAAASTNRGDDVWLVAGTPGQVTNAAISGVAAIGQSLDVGSAGDIIRIKIGGF